MFNIKNRFNLWLFIYAAPTILLVMLLLSPLLWFGIKFKIPSGTEPFIIINPPEDSLLPKVAEALYGTSLTLDNIEICLVNRNQISNEEVVYILPSKKDPEAGAMEIKLQYADNTEQYIYAPVNNTKCSILPLKKINRAFLTRRGFADSDIKTFVQSDNSYITYNMILSELVAKIIILFLGWLVFMVNFMTSIKYIDDKTSKKETR